MCVVYVSEICIYLYYLYVWYYLVYVSEICF